MYQSFKSRVILVAGKRLDQHVSKYHRQVWRKFLQSPVQNSRDALGLDKALRSLLMYVIDHPHSVYELMRTWSGSPTLRPTVGSTGQVITSGWVNIQGQTLRHVLLFTPRAPRTFLETVDVGYFSESHISVSRVDGKFGAGRPRDLAGIFACPEGSEVDHRR